MSPIATVCHNNNKSSRSKLRLVDKKRRCRGSRSVSGRSSDMSGTRRCCSVGVTFCDFSLAIGMDSTGELGEYDLGLFLPQETDNEENIRACLARMESIVEVHHKAPVQTPSGTKRKQYAKVVFKPITSNSKINWRVEYEPGDHEVNFLVKQ
ncbi:hypothetical protein ACFE04_011194 [Oxalis oulophora]